MKRILLSLVLSLTLLPSLASAQQVCPRCGRVHAPVARAVTSSIARPVATSVAQAKANRMAATGRLSHAGQLAGPYEGVGYSTRSADAAIRACCYWGRRTPVAIGVARGRSGWYACVGYR